MMSKFGVLLLAVLAVLIVIAMPDEARANPSLEEGLDVAEAIRYLEKLDKYYSQIARPRYGRSTESRRRGIPVPFRSRKFDEETDRR